MTEKVNATLKVYYLFNNTKCLARGSTVAATPIAPGADVATIDLRTCALAVCSSSPELIGDKSMDYSIYTLDASEGLDSDLYEGQGLLSWGLSQPVRLAKTVSGFIKPSLSGTVLEIRMKLSQVVQSSQQDFITSMQSFERISRTLPATFDYSNWNEFMKHTTGALASSPSINGVSPNMPLQSTRNSQLQVNTLQKARELAGRQNPQSMSAQLKTARQQQSSQQRHARMIAQQAAATQANHNGLLQTQQNQQKRAISTDLDGPSGSQPASPPLPTPSSPPQMKTFAPPPSAVARSNSLPMQSGIDTGAAVPQLAKFASISGIESSTNAGNRGTKRKASELRESTNRVTARSVLFSPAKAVNAAKNNIGAIQQLFKAKSPANTAASPNTTVLDKLQQIKDSASNVPVELPRPALVKQESSNSATGALPGPNLKTLQRNDAELLRALEDGHPIKFCYNCGNIQTRGNWRQLEVHGKKHNLCNACGVYWKTKHRMRPEKLWDRNRAIGDPSKVNDFPSTIPLDSRGKTGDLSSAPATSEADQYDLAAARTSPVRPMDRQTFQQTTRETRSSPATNNSAIHKVRFPTLVSQARANTNDGRPRTPTRETLHELQINTPSAMPSPSPASGNGIEDLVALLQTPKKSFSSKVLSSPSPWRSMFTLLDDVQKEGPQSPSRYKLDKLLEDLGMTNGTGAGQFDFDAIANFSLSPNANNNIDSLASFMSSPPGMGVFTSSAGLENDDSTPEDLTQPLSAQKNKDLLATPRKGDQRLPGHFEEGDSLFTPKRYKTRSQPGSVQRQLRSAGSSCGEEVFGGVLK